MGCIPRLAAMLPLLFTATAHAGNDGDTDTGDPGTGIYVNGTELLPADVTALAKTYGIRIGDAELSSAQAAAIKKVFGVDVDGRRFWYDRVFGAWGYIGLPPAGRLRPNIPFAAEMPEDASGGGTDVVVNGRILHPTEVVYLRQQYGYVIPGRYYLWPDGTYGFEGQAPSGRLPLADSRRGGAATGSFGTAIGDGDFVGYIPPRGWGDSSTPSVTCAPDGGCIF